VDVIAIVRTSAKLSPIMRLDAASLIGYYVVVKHLT
jgi:hypothetical protein